MNWSIARWIGDRFGGAAPRRYGRRSMDPSAAAAAAQARAAAERREREQRMAGPPNVHTGTVTPTSSVAIRRWLDRREVETQRTERLTRTAREQEERYRADPFSRPYKDPYTGKMVDPGPSAF